VAAPLLLVMHWQRPSPINKPRISRINTKLILNYLSFGEIIIQAIYCMDNYTTKN
jgi:hypothetical protein